MDDDACMAFCARDRIRRTGKRIEDSEEVCNRWDPLAGMLAIPPTFFESKVPDRNSTACILCGVELGSVLTLGVVDQHEGA